MSEFPSERVLVVPTDLFRQVGYFQGFCREVDRYLAELFSPSTSAIAPAREVERDPGFKQLIPYVIFRHRDDRGRESVLQYTRGTGHGRRPPAPQAERGHRRPYLGHRRRAATAAIPMKKACAASWRRKWPSTRPTPPAASA